MSKKLRRFELIVAEAPSRNYDYLRRMNEQMDAPDKAVVLLSGGLDSYTCLAIAKSRGYAPYALTVIYGQRHDAEVRAAEKIAKEEGAEEHKILRVNLSDVADSALTREGRAIPKGRESAEIGGGEIPSTYVPARNSVFLALAASYAESVGASRIFIGVNALDYSGYPDCRPQFIEAMQAALNLGTKTGGLVIETPLINMTKAEIIRAGSALGLDYSKSVTCYDADAEGRACRECDACLLRKKGFKEAGINDPTIYRS